MRVSVTVVGTITVVSTVSHVPQLPQEDVPQLVPHDEPHPPVLQPLPQLVAPQPPQLVAQPPQDA